MSQRSFHVATGVLGAMALGALTGACAAIYRSCRRSDLELVALVVAFAAGILVLGMLLGRWLLTPTRSGFLAVVLWLLTMAAGIYIFGKLFVECLNT